ncbi:hypothetical protein KQX64_23945 [Rhodopseudomonas palustris]|nr:hypothetical protein KQX64_23945 [Rhodopseudomonas palustris]
MEEVKRRIDVVSGVTLGRIAVPQIVAVELAYLQLRMICELIALACLAAHGDVPETQAKRLMKAYNADQIIKSLGRLNPSFYPKPGRQVKDAAGRVTGIVDIDEPYLTKVELQRLYGECGDFLHRGNIEQVMRGRRLPTLSHLDAWKCKVVALLNHHQIQLFHPDHQLWTIMQAASDGRVHATEFLKIDPSTLTAAGAA